MIALTTEDHLECLIDNLHVLVHKLCGVLYHRGSMKQVLAENVEAVAQIVSKAF
ncbi:hypothetical protein L798_01956 [Zootermopsis nevadensis]|uniref:Uncharacterized protein n=1 Tax=Zootermopsis nevadensis TaxID=136037 RepID=A0A067QI87_ZOONE|nr:hypothetical protein L798_01956 [Zootermopsis nevadensis]